MTPGPPHATPPVDFLDTGAGADAGTDAGTSAGDAHRIDFVECPPPPLSADEHREVDRRWAATTAANPAAFDGPIVAVLALGRPAPGRTAVRWARMTYRHRALRALRPAGAVPGSVFVTVLQPTDEGLVLGRGSRTTAAPGRWSLPGGGAEPPPPGGSLDLAVLRRHAAVELAEEVGLAVPESELRLWGVSRGARYGSLGFYFLAPGVAAARVRRCHAAVVAEERARGLVPELDALAFAAPDAVPPDAAPEPYADYLPQLLARYRANRDRAG